LLPEAVEGGEGEEEGSLRLARRAQRSMRRSKCEQAEERRTSPADGSGKGGVGESDSAGEEERGGRVEGGRMTEEKKVGRW
jgi:hypothetical protein